MKTQTDIENNMLVKELRSAMENRRAATVRLIDGDGNKMSLTDLKKGRIERVARLDELEYSFEEGPNYSRIINEAGIKKLLKDALPGLIVDAGDDTLLIDKANINLIELVDDDIDSVKNGLRRLPFEFCGYNGYIFEDGSAQVGCQNFDPDEVQNIGQVLRQRGGHPSVHADEAMEALPVINEVVARLKRQKKTSNPTVSIKDIRAIVHQKFAAFEASVKAAKSKPKKKVAKKTTRRR